MLAQGDSLEIVATIAAYPGHVCGFKVRASNRQETRVGIDGPSGCFFLDRTRSGQAVAHCYDTGGNPRP